MVDWYFYFGFEEREHEYLYRALLPDDVVIDVGANIGLVAIQIADTVPKGEVHAFEPYKENFNRLIENIELNSVRNLQTYNLGLSDGEKGVSLYSPEEKNTGMVSVNLSKDGKTQLTTLDLFCEEMRIDKVSFIKIDVEGYEAKVLKGARKTLEFFKPKLFVELNHRHLIKYGDSAIGLISLIESHGYQCTDCSNGKRLTPDMELDHLQTDIFAEPL